MAKTKVIMSVQEYERIQVNLKLSWEARQEVSRLKEAEEGRERTTAMFTACLKRMQELGRGTGHETPSQFMDDAELGRLVRSMPKGVALGRTYSDVWAKFKLGDLNSQIWEKSPEDALNSAGLGGNS